MLLIHAGAGGAKRMVEGLMDGSGCGLDRRCCTAGIEPDRCGNAYHVLGAIGQ
jgi:hypothetical protein